MRKKLLVAAQDLPIDLNAAKTALGFDGIDMYNDQIKAALLGIAADVEHRTGQKLLTQTWKLMGVYAGGRFQLPHPVQQVVNIDIGGIPVTDFELEASELATELILRGQFSSAEQISITLVCGYASPAQIPANISLYISARLQEFFASSTARSLSAGGLESLLASSITYT